MAPTRAVDPKPLVVAVEMGYGHLRPARALARALGVEVSHVDRPPLAGREEQALWARVRRGYESMSRLSQVKVVGPPLKALLDAITVIKPLDPDRDLSKAGLEVRFHGLMMTAGLGRGMVEHLRRTGAPLLTTFYTPAVAADRAGLERVHCLITDADCNRIWVAKDARRSRIQYFAPSERVVRRLEAYGVAPERIRLTGFPLPHELLGGPGLDVARRNLAARLVRLDPNREFLRSQPEIATELGTLPESERGRPPLLTFPIGGAGAQVGLAAQFLPSLKPLIAEGRLRLALVAGVRQEVARKFEQMLRDNAMDALGEDKVQVLLGAGLDDYFARFEALLAETDILWSKPSEMTFYAALGLPFVCAPPMGEHEDYNRSWAAEHGAGLEQGDPRFAAQWLTEWLEDGTLAGAAWAGFKRLPSRGLYQILSALGASSPK